MNNRITRRFVDVQGLIAYVGTDVFPTPKAVYNKVHLQLIPHLKIGSSLRFDLDEIDAWLDSCRISPRQEN